MTEIWEFDEHATSSVPARCPMTDTYGHDEAAAFIAAVLPTYGEGGWWRNEMEKLAAYITRLEAADTRLLAALDQRAIEAACELAKQASSLSLAYGDEEKSSKPASKDMRLRWRKVLADRLDHFAAALAARNAAIEQAKEGRS